MIRGSLLVTAFLATLVSGCSPTPVVITAELSSEDATEGMVVTSLGDLEVRLLPFDRDAIFDSLTSVASRPNLRFLIQSFRQTLKLQRLNRSGATQKSGGVFSVTLSKL